MRKNYLLHALALALLSPLPLNAQKYTNAMKEIVEDGVRWMVRYNEEGQLVMKYQHEHGVFHGKSIEFYESGIIRAEGFFTKGTPTGSWRTYYESGKVRANYTLKQLPTGPGKVGPFLWYYENGNVMEQSNYVEGLAQGEYLKYHESGGLSVKGQYMNGLKEGEWVDFNEDGVVVLKGVYTRNAKTGDWTRYYDDGTWQCTTTYEMDTIKKEVCKN